jgi:predicted nucleic acid-binding protein
MIVVSDTSPLNYLVLVEAVQFLPDLFGQVVAPPAVLAELQHSRTPAKIKRWAANPPTWLRVLTPAPFAPFARLDLGESEAIALAKQLNADALLIDERHGSAVAKQLGLTVVGTLGVLELAAEKGQLALPVAIADLRRTAFRAPESLIAEMLRRDHSRKSRVNPTEESNS